MPTPSNLTPSTIQIKTEKVLETTICGCREYVMYVNGQEYKKLPLDANVREPDEKKSKPYKDMCETLSDHPENFFENNLGISVIASNVRQDTANKYTLEFQNGTGILNGGHTQLAVLSSQTNPNIDKAIIRLTVRVKNYSEERIAEIAAAQNSSTAVKEYSLAEKKGLFADLKRCLEQNKEKHIIWWEGKNVAANKGMEPSDLIAILNVFNIMIYSSRWSTSTTQPTQSANGKASVFKRWETTDSLDDYKMIYPLVNDILELYELIENKFADGSGMARLAIIGDTKGKGKELIFSTEICPYVIPKQMLFPLLAAYRANIYYDAVNKKIGWYEDNKILFKKYNKELCKKLISSYKASGNVVNKLSKDPTLWENLYTTLRDAINTQSTFKEYDI